MIWNRLTGSWTVAHVANPTVVLAGDVEYLHGVVAYYGNVVTTSRYGGALR